MNSKEFKQELIQELLLNIQPSYYKNYELNVRCPFCGDSIKNANSAHLSIRINPDDDQPLMFRCLRCNTTGIFNGTTLSMIGVYSSNNSTNIERYNRLSCKKHNLIINNKRGLNIKFPELQITDLVLQKHKYIEDRLGTSLDIQDLHNKKIVYDFIGLLKYNKIEKLYGDVYHIKALQIDHVGFLSARNDFINFRDMTGNHKRYYIYKIARNLDTTGKFYIIPNNIDPFNNDIKYINLTEGVFDILGLYYNIMNRYDYNTVYASINGSGYLNVIKYILEQGLLCDVNVNIFSDSDRSPSYYKNMIRTLMPFVNDVRLFYNDIGKDYGVPKDKVKLKEVDINYMK